MKKLLKAKKGMKPLTIVLIIVVIAAFLAIAGSNLNFRDFKAANVYQGRLQVNNVEIKRLDGSAYDMADSFYRMIHGSGDYNDKVGTYSSDSVTGEVKAADNGIWYLVIDYGTNTSNWLDWGESLKDPYIVDIFGKDGDRDGFDETYIKLDFSGLGPLKAGEDKKEVEITTVWDVADLDPTFTSLTNASSIGTSSYSYYTATGYVSGTAEGEMLKLAKIQLSFSDSGNGSYPDNEYWKLTHLKLGPYTFTATKFGGYDLSNTRYEIKFGDQVNHQGGKDLYKAKNSGDLWATYELKAYCNYPSASKTILVHMKFYFYKPDGTLTSAIERVVSFAS